MTFPEEVVPDIDLGDGHYLTFNRWAPDDLPGNRAWLGIPLGPLPVVERWGATVRHYRPGGTLCESAITFDGEWQRRLCEPQELWAVQSWEPLTVTPSLLCRAPVLGPDGEKVGECGDHGFISNGKWVRA
jgi:hypothetical protein